MQSNIKVTVRILNADIMVRLRHALLHIGMDHQIGSSQHELALISMAFYISLTQHDSVAIGIGNNLKRVVSWCTIGHFRV